MNEADKCLSETMGRYKKLVEFVQRFTSRDWAMTPDDVIGNDAYRLLKEIGEI